MKKWLLGLGVFAASAGLVACGNSGEKDGSKVTVGASNVPHAEILEEAKPLLKEKGFDLEIKVFDDYILPNRALQDEEIDANFFQHRPYLDQQIADHGYDFVEVGAVHLEPIGLYSQDYDKLDELPDGATVLMSNSVSDYGRILSLLQEAGLITLKDGVSAVEATEADIVENPKNIRIDAGPNPEMLPQAYQSNEADVVAINSNFAMGAGISPVEEAIYLEAGDESNPYANIVVTRKDSADDEAVKALISVLGSDEIKAFIDEKYAGAVIAVD
ncbi:MetQ/NlpA family ABC transporter substrate-binding protein [Bacillus sp. FSL W7-1360]